MQSLLVSLDTHCKKTRGFYFDEIAAHTSKINERWWTIPAQQSKDLGLFDYVEVPNLSAIVKSSR